MSAVKQAIALTPAGHAQAGAPLMVAEVQLDIGDAPDPQTGCHGEGEANGEFSGEDIKDKENLILQPFTDLLKRDEFKGAQLIITGASFTGLEEAHAAS
jgi:hypothetical protein